MAVKSIYVNNDPQIMLDSNYPTMAENLITHTSQDGGEVLINKFHDGVKEMGALPKTNPANT